MVEQIIFRCNECGYYFRSSDRDVYVEEEQFCYYCGTVFGIRVLGDAEAFSGPSSKEKDLGKCKECGEDIRKRIVAVCPKCRTRSGKIQGTITG
jgi:DNA-directed RNA polymerase subunit RPC12/RpoP